MKIDPVSLEIIWGRLIAAVDEVGATLRRTAFSTIVSESNDFACVLLDHRGNSLAQTTFSVPSFICTMPITVKHFLRLFGTKNMSDGDVFITNDPWLASGHLPDLTVITPIFYNSELIGFSASVAHKTDMGGRFYAVEASEVYEEGLRIPPARLFQEGQLNQTLLGIIEANVRSPNEVTGDIMAQVAANRVGAAKLLEVISDEGLNNFKQISGEMLARSEQAMRKAIVEIPDGIYDYVVDNDGFDEPTRIQVAITVEGSNITVDYTGTSPQRDKGINSVYNYTYAYTNYALKSAINPDIPNNEGSFRPVKVFAPEGSILNPRYPAPVGARQLTGHFIPFAIFGALSKAIPNRVVAPSGMEGSSFLRIKRRNGENVTVFFTSNGGFGARPGKDGPACLAFPSNISNTPVEIMEKRTSLLFEQKALAIDSGGVGQYRGGCGQTYIIRMPDDAESVILALRCDRTQHPAEGLLGGGKGTRRINMLDGKELHSKKHCLMKAGDRLTIHFPGGGGYGDPQSRERKRVKEDILNGYVSLQAAAQQYGYALNDDNE